MSDGLDQFELDDVCEAIVNAEMSKVNTALPGVVVSYDSGSQLATVKLATKWKRVDPDGVTSEFSVEPITQVPVVWPQSSGFALTFPLQSGDPILLIVCQRSIDEYLATGEVDSSAQSKRRFSLADSYAIPCGNPANAIEGVSTDSVDFGQTGTGLTVAKVQVTDAGKIAVGNRQTTPIPGTAPPLSAKSEVLDLLDQILTVLITMTVPTSLGTQIPLVGTPPQPVSTYIVSLQTALNNIK